MTNGAAAVESAACPATARCRAGSRASPTRAWNAAARLAVREAQRGLLPGAPMHLVDFSNGRVDGSGRRSRDVTPGRPRVGQCGAPGRKARIRCGKSSALPAACAIAVMSERRCSSSKGSVVSSRPVL